MNFAQDEWTGIDKWQHMLIGFVMSFIIFLACFFGVCESKIIAAIVSLVLCLMVNIGKEIYDCYKKNPTGFSYKDALWAVTGNVIAVLLLVIIT